MQFVSEKQKLRSTMRKCLREHSAGRVLPSARIWNRFLHVEEFRWETESDAPPMGYLELADEVITFPYLIQLPLFAVPYIDGADLKPLLVHGPDELIRTEPFGIREPLPELRKLTERQIDPASLKLVIVPGLAFDDQGHRLGRGKGYYDRFLSTLPTNTPIVALAFECQIVDSVPVEPHDRHVDWIITEKRVLDCRS